MGDGSIKALPGGVDEYLAKRVRRPASPSAATAAAEKPKGDSRAARKELQKLERQLVNLDKRESELHAQMAAQASDHEAVIALNEELHQVRAQKEAVETAWLELSDQV